MLTVPLAELRTETRVSNSRFIAIIGPATSMEEARNHLYCLRQEFADATHHVPAFVIGGGASCQDFCSDDGEPSGTAGRPLLAVLKGSGLGNAALVVVRYFGGTQLGTGGLVKAYTECGQRAVELVRRGRLVSVVRLELRLPYPLYERCKQACAAAGATVHSEEFLTDIQIRLSVAEERFETFREQLAELSSGGIVPLVLGRGLETQPIP